MEISKLLEALDAKVFTVELKESLEAQFNEAVEIKALILAEAKIEEATKYLNEKSEQHIEFLSEKADEYVQMKQDEMLESLDKFLDRAVEEFVLEAKDALDESIKSERADMIIEAFDSMLTATGVTVAKIVEAKEAQAFGDSDSDSAKLEETIKKYDAVVEEIITLQEENDTLIKMGVIMELKEGLSIVEAEKFEKLAELVEFTKDEKFSEKLATIKESVKGTVETKENIDESTKQVKAPWAHLV